MSALRTRDGEVNMAKLERRVRDYILYAIENYHENKRQLEEYQRDVIESKDYTISGQPRGTDTTDSTQAKAIKLQSSPWLIQTERTTRAIEKALSTVEESHRTAIKLMFWDKTHTACGAGMVVGASERTVYRWVKCIVLAIAKDLGYL